MKQVTINIPFTYTLGEVGFYTEKVLETEQDCKLEVLAEIENGALEQDVYLETEKTNYEQGTNKRFSGNNSIYNAE